MSGEVSRDQIPRHGPHDPKSGQTSEEADVASAVAASALVAGRRTALSLGGAQRRCRRRRLAILARVDRAGSSPRVVVVGIVQVIVGGCPVFDLLLPLQPGLVVRDGAVGIVNEARIPAAAGVKDAAVATLQRTACEALRHTCLPVQIALVALLAAIDEIVAASQGGREVIVAGAESCAGAGQVGVAGGQVRRGAG